MFPCLPLRQKNLRGNCYWRVRYCPNDLLLFFAPLFTASLPPSLCFQTIVLYPVPNIVTCTMRIWLREIGFALAYGALMLKTWR